MRFLTIIAVLAGLSLGLREAFAKLGEGETAISDRYGASLGDISTGGLVGKIYRFEGFNVGVLFSDQGKAVAELFRPLDVGRHLSASECLALARAVTGHTDWTAKNLLGNYSQEWRSPGGGVASWDYGILKSDVLIIYGAAALDLWDKKERQSANDLELAFSADGKAADRKGAGESVKPVLLDVKVRTQAQIEADKKVEANRLKFTVSQATNGVASAQYDLALRYLQGNGVDKDEAQAREWFEKAASKGHTYAKRALETLKVKPAK